MAAPSITVRIDPDTIELLKHITGNDKTATAIREAIHDRIDQGNVSDISDISAIGNKFVSTKTAAMMLKMTDRNIRYMAENGKIEAIQLNGKNGRWLINIEAIKIMLIPKIEIRN